MTPPQAARAGHLLANGWGKKDAAAAVNVTPQELRDWIRSEKRRRKGTASSVHMITYQGRTQCLLDWSRELRMSYDMLLSRRRRGWSAERILSTPPPAKTLRMRAIKEEARRAWKKATTDREKEIVWANYGDVLA